MSASHLDHLDPHPLPRQASADEEGPSVGRPADPLAPSGDAVDLGLDHVPHRWGGRRVRIHRPPGYETPVRRRTCAYGEDVTRLAPEAVVLEVAEEPEAWARAGFAVDADATCRIGGLRIALVGTEAGEAVVGWALRHLPDDAPPDLDGLATRRDERVAAEPADHPNGVTRVDHLVLLTDDLERTVAAAGRLGLEERRRRDHRLPGRDPMVQSFFRVGELVLEVVAPADPPTLPAPGVRSFGLALTVADLDVAGAVLGEHLSPARTAVQQGRRIATVRHRDLGMRTPLALMTPRPPATASGPS